MFNLLLSINNECPRLTKIKENNLENELFQKEMNNFISKHGNELIDIFDLYNKTLINDYNILSTVIEHYLSYYKNKQFNEKNEVIKLPKDKLDILFKDCIEFKNKSYLLVEATKDISIITMSATLKKLVKYMEERIAKLDQFLDKHKNLSAEVFDEGDEIKQGLTQDDLAKMLNMSRQNYNIIENNPTKADLNKIYEIFNLLNEPIDDFLNALKQDYMSQKKEA